MKHAQSEFSQIK